MVGNLYWIIPLCLILGLFFHRQLGWILLGILILLWWLSKRIKLVIAAPFIFAWKIGAFPFRIIWTFDGYDGVHYSMRAQWRRDTSVYFARLIISLVAEALFIKGGIFLYHLLLHK
jgi:hypothetical protein